MLYLALFVISIKKCRLAGQAFCGWACMERWRLASSALIWCWWEGAPTTAALRAVSTCFEIVGNAYSKI